MATGVDRTADLLRMRQPAGRVHRVAAVAWWLDGVSKPLPAFRALLAACALLGCGIRANRSGPIGVSLDLPAGKGCNAAVGRSTPIVRLRVALAGSVARVLLVRATGCMQLA